MNQRSHFFFVRTSRRWRRRRVRRWINDAVDAVVDLTVFTQILFFSRSCWGRVADEEVVNDRIYVSSCSSLIFSIDLSSIVHKVLGLFGTFPSRLFQTARKRPFWNEHRLLLYFLQGLGGTRKLFILLLILRMRFLPFLLYRPCSLGGFLLGFGFDSRWFVKICFFISVVWLLRVNWLSMFLLFSFFYLFDFLCAVMSLLCVMVLGFAISFLPKSFRLFLELRVCLQVKLSECDKMFIFLFSGNVFSFNLVSIFLHLVFIWMVFFVFEMMKIHLSFKKK